MPKLRRGKKKKQRRVVCRVQIKKVDGIWWMKAYDQGSNRYPEADFSHKYWQVVVKTARKRVNRSYSVE